MPLESQEYKEIGSGETRNAFVSFMNLLEAIPVEKLTGTPTITVSPTGPTLSNKALNTSTVEVKGETRDPSVVVQFTVDSCTDATDYTITISVATDAVNAQTFVRKVKLLCRD